MKGSEYRKRYILVFSRKIDSVLPGLERELFRTFRSKKKFSGGNYAIFLTNQFYKEQIIGFIKNRFSSVETLITSGTLKKCKTVMNSHKMAQESLEKEISALP